MPIQVISTARKYLSDVVKGANTPDNSNAMQFNYDGIALSNLNGGAGTIPTSAVEPIGIPVIFDAVDGWVIYNALALDIAGGASDLPDASPIGVAVGNKFGAGFNPADVTLVAAPAADNVVVFFRGANNAGVVRNSVEEALGNYPFIDFAAGGVTPATIAQINLFYAQLEKQGIMVIDNAEVITPSFTD